MTLERGFLSALSIAVEQTFGGTPGTAAAIDFNTHSLKATKNLVKAATIRGTRNPVNPSIGFQDVQGDIEVPLGYGGTMATILNAMGGVNGVLGFAATNHDQPSLQIIDGGGLTYKGCKVSRLSFRFGGDGELTCTMSVIGKSGEAAGTVTDMPAELARVLWSQLAVSLGGAASTDIMECSVDIDFGLDGKVYPIGCGGTRKHLPEGIVSVSGSIKALFDGTTILAMGLNTTKRAFLLSADGGNGYVFSISIPEATFAIQDIGVPGPDSRMISLTFEAGVGTVSNPVTESVVTITSTGV